MLPPTMITVTLLGQALFVATIFADEKADYASPTVFHAVPGWIADTAPLTGATRRFPAVLPPFQTSPSQPVKTADDGTWRDEGGFVVIKLGGREFRLRKTASKTATTSPTATRVTLSARSATNRASDSQPVAVRGGTVEGRLRNRRRPLVGCKVSLIPLRRAYFGYSIDGDGQPQTAKTDANGDYHFDRVPPGSYKLYWLPAGHRRWIRRLKIKPDVVVRNAATTRVKTIRVALRTIN